MPDRPLRILHIISASDAGGLSRYVYDLAAAMHSLGHDVRVAGARGAWHHLFEQAKFPFIEAPVNGNPIAMWLAARRLRKLEVDVIHTHYRRATRVARWMRVPTPILYTVHLSHIPFGRPLSWSKDFGDYTHVASADARQWTIDGGGVPADRITLIPHGLHVERYPRADAASRRAARQRFNLTDADRVACYVGRLDDPKNEDWLLDVADRSRERIPNLKLLIAGTGPHAAQFTAAIAARNLAGRVITLGELADPLPVYQASDAFLLPSSQEGFSLGCAEAMCVGVAPLRTRTAGTTELIIENVTGQSTPIDREAFIAAAIDFLADADALARMGQAASEHIRANFTYQRQLDRTIALYESLRAKAGAR